MNKQPYRMPLCLAATLVAGLGLPARAQGQSPGPSAPPCSVDLAITGHMKDVLSNALLQGRRLPEKDVRAFLLDAEKNYATGPALVRAAAEHFSIDEASLEKDVERHRHVNCEHGQAADTAAPGPVDAGVPVSTFAGDVTLHVVLHEIGHALIREFDIPVLANEEAAADAFATYYLTTYLPERAPRVLSARVTSLMIEAAETPEVDWSGEHDDDARRAFHIAALAVAADPVKYKGVAALVNMSEGDLSDARDYGAELRRSWRRVLAPLWMPEGVASGEARVVVEPASRFVESLRDGGLVAEIENAITRFDWHSQVTVRFVDGKGGAGWSRSGRTITVHSEYVRRFVAQGDRGVPGGP